mmetsp:Transcript_88783/g.160064  ORF Transcript_88783/g.160064 Transcript_88783/m.160064 type:complete len:204 (-) Transcript_88783:307-918(-)
MCCSRPQLEREDQGSTLHPRLQEEPKWKPLGLAQASAEQTGKPDWCSLIRSSSHSHCMCRCSSHHQLDRLPMKCNGQVATPMAGREFPCRSIHSSSRWERSCRCCSPLRRTSLGSSCLLKQLAHLRVVAEDKSDLCSLRRSSDHSCRRCKCSSHPQLDTRHLGCSGLLAVTQEASLDRPSLYSQQRSWSHPSGSCRCCSRPLL